MRLYLCTTDTGCSEFLFTTDQERATQLFTTYLFLAEVEPSTVSISELTLATVPSEHRRHLESALAQGIEAFASYELGRGWVMCLIQHRFDQLSAAASKRDVQC